MKKTLLLIIFYSIFLVPNKCFAGKFLFWYWTNSIHCNIKDSSTGKYIGNVEVNIIWENLNKKPTKKISDENRGFDINKEVFFCPIVKPSMLWSPVLKIVLTHPEYETLEIPHFIYWDWKSGGHWFYKYTDMKTKTAEIMLKKKRE
ncbi:MAG: hypothetical protein Q7K21_04870 [Elusimicrobiota bacterium]|nr:hypothetical protein [Elusimicrobiota bacterium]